MMIRESVRVVSVAGHGTDRILVSPQPGNSCGGCDSRAACSTGMLMRSSGIGRGPFEARTDQALTAGETVIVGIAGSGVLISAIIAYLLPALSLIVGALIGHAMVPGTDTGALIGALAGLGAGIASGSLLSRRLAAGGRFEPRVLERNCHGLTDDDTR